MKHTLEKFDLLAAPLRSSGQKEIAALRSAYANSLSDKAEGADTFCGGILMALSGLKPDLGKPDLGKQYLPILEKLLSVTWYPIKAKIPITFFHVAGSFEAITSGECMVFNILKELAFCWNYLQNNDGVSSVLRSITTFVCFDISGEYEVIAARSGPMLQAIAECHRLNPQFQLAATGSDTHCNGRQALYLTSPQTKLVYKPRPLHADQAFFQLIDYYNTLKASLEKKSPLPKITFRDSKEDWGTECFVPHIDAPMTQQEAESYYFKMGELMLLARLFGMGDLHQDNLIPTRDGPLIIDAECCLQPNVLRNFSLNSTQIFSTVQRCETADPAQTASSVFQIGTACSTKLYPQFRDNIVQGFRFAAGILRANQSDITAKILELHRTIKKIRIVPLSTYGFASIDPSKPLANTSEWDALLKNLTDLLNKNLFDINRLADCVKNALDRYDIPYFYFEPGADKQVYYLMCENQQLSATDFYSSESLCSAIHETVSWLLSEQPEQEILNTLK